MWLILRTDARKEAYVARQVQNMGFEAWVPVRKIVQRTAGARRITAKAKEKLPTKDYPIMARRLFAAVPVALEATLLRIRHVAGIERDASMRPALVSDGAIARFRAAVDAANNLSVGLAVTSKEEKIIVKSLKDLGEAVARKAKEQFEAAA